MKSLIILALGCIVWALFVVPEWRTHVMPMLWLVLCIVAVAALVGVGERVAGSGWNLPWKSSKKEGP